MADAFVEVWAATGIELFAIESARTTLGRDPGNDVRLADRTVSKLHAVIERYEGGFTLRDLGSSNGTYVNGDRLVAEKQLSDGDEIVLGESRLRFRSVHGGGVTATAAAEEPPQLTRREREVLVALCRPLAGGAPFAQPATVAQLAQEFVVTEAAIKAHLANLYEKFEIGDTEGTRRFQLAAEAIRRRAVTLGDLRVG